MFYEVIITRHPAGFGMWQAQAVADEGWASDDDLLHAITDNVQELWELGRDELPEGVEDIRGLVYNEPARVFAVRRNGQEPVDYLGITDGA